MTKASFIKKWRERLAKNPSGWSPAEVVSELEQTLIEPSVHDVITESMATSKPARFGIIIQFQLEGWHYWPEAPSHAAYLGQSHRHMFHYKCHLHLTDLDRQVEFFAAQKKLRELARYQLSQNSLWPSTSSCEQLAKDLLDAGLTWYQGLFRVEVWEDNENGGYYEIGS